MKAAIERTGAGEIAIAQRLHREFARERHMAGNAGDLAQREARGVPASDRVRRLGRGRIDQHAQHCVLGTQANHGRKQAGGIAVAARAGIVLRIREHHRRAALATLHRASDRLIG